MRVREKHPKKEGEKNFLLSLFFVHDKLNMQTFGIIKFTQNSFVVFG